MNLSFHVLLLGAVAEEPALPESLTPLGWTIMLASIGAVLTLVAFCLYRVLTLPPVDDSTLQGPLRIDTGDTEDAD